MLCNVMSLEAKTAKNGNWYVTVVAQPAEDIWADELTYRMWCSEELASKLVNNKPSTIELRKVSVTVEPFQRMEDDVIGERVFDKLSVVVRQHKGADIDDPQRMADKLRSQLLKDGLIIDVTVMDDAFDGATGASDIPE